MLTACGQQIEVAESRLGAVGESCEARSDCASDLHCVDRLCVSEAPVQLQGDAGQAPPVEVRNGLGQRCFRRADCQAELSCIAQRCTEGGDAISLLGPQKGAIGDSCLVSNDCEVGLGCVSRACRARSLAVAPTALECHRVECQVSDDCCAGFEPEDPDLCAELDVGCQSGVAADCNLHRALCGCTMRCEDEACVAQAACESDLDCGGSGILRCIGGGCVQCVTDGDCAGSGVCQAGTCRSPCERNEECALFEACVDSRCEHVGCQSDRECQFAYDDPEGRCIDAECRSACTTDATCRGQFQRCAEGLCVFVGCESDEECRAALAADGTNLAVGAAMCRPPML